MDAVRGGSLVADLVLLEEARRGYRRDRLLEEYHYRVEEGLRGVGLARPREAAELVRATAWLMDARECGVDGGRGTSPAALASAAVYWAWLVEHARGVVEEPPSAQRAWQLTGSSRASFYRAVRAWARCLLGMEDHRPLLRGEARIAKHGGEVARYPGFFIVVLRGYIPAAAGAHKLRLGRLAPAELLLLPAAYTRRDRAMSDRVSVTFDYDKLRRILEERFDYKPFRTEQFAELLALHYPSAAQLLRRLRDVGIVERLGDGLWILREKAGYISCR